MGKGIFQEHTRRPVTFGDVPAPGDMTWIDPSTGLIYNHDDTRTKWLSAAKHTFEYARKGSVRGMYIPLLGDLDDAEDVYMPGKSAVIVAIFCRSMSGNKSAEFEIRKNGAMLYEFVYDGSNNRRHINTNLDYNVEVYDKLQVYVKPVGTATRNVVCRIETAWRYDV